ncbi:MAG: LysM peptidoglycan-binding domain-containing protein [Janthinobacterium lividum]
MSTTALALPMSGAFEFRQFLPQRDRGSRPLALVPALPACPLPVAVAVRRPRSAQVRPFRGCATAPAHRPLRLTRRGRLSITCTAVTVLTGAVFVASIVGGAPAGAGDVVGSVPRVITVLPGQTLSQIAGELAPTQDWREVAADIVALNDLQSEALQSGQELSLPPLE